MKKTVSSFVIIFTFGFLVGLALRPYLPTTITVSIPQLPTPPVRSLVTPRPEVTGATGQTATVARVVDGDTIQLDNGETLRYIGIDTPETKHPTKGVQCYGKIASAKNTELVGGKQVRLEKDVSERDKYGRLLRFVYVQTPQGELFVNDYLVREGYARAVTYPPDVKYTEHFKASEQQARVASKGLWKECPL